MKNKNSSLLVAAVMSASVVYGGCGGSLGPVEVAGCLIDKGAILYGTEWCGYTKKQIEEFDSEGWEVMKQNYFECSVSGIKGSVSLECINIGLKAFPTWDFGDGLERGFKTLEELEDICYD